MKAYTLGIDGGASPIVWDVGGRLTFETGVAISTSDQADKTTVYWTPFRHGQIALFSSASGAWEMHTTAEISKALGTLTSGKNYDVFASITSDGGSVELSFGDAWTSDTARSTALVRKDGVLVKSAAAPTHRYLGTFRTTSTTQSQDKLLQRYLWNYYNQVPKELVVNEATNSWTYNSATFQQANAAAGNKVEFVCGDTCYVRAKARSVGGGDSAADHLQAGIGVDSVTVNSAQTGGSMASTAAVGSWADIAEYKGHVTVGYHYVAWLEACAATVTMLGDNNIAGFKTGLVVEVQG